MPLTAAEVERRRRTAVEQNLGRNLIPGSHLYPAWTKKELALLGKVPDREVAARTGRTLKAVQQKRLTLGIPAPLRPRRRR